MDLSKLQRTIISAFKMMKMNHKKSMLANSTEDQITATLLFSIPMSLSSLFKLENNAWQEMGPWDWMRCIMLNCTDEWLSAAESKIPAVYGRSYVEIPLPKILRLWKTI